MAGSDEVLRICFVSRICEKKNLAFALDVLSNSKARIRSTLRPQKTAYWALCNGNVGAAAQCGSPLPGILANDQFSLAGGA
jgi:hypothetical protein